MLSQIKAWRQERGLKPLPRRSVPGFRRPLMASRQRPSRNSVEQFLVV